MANETPSRPPPFMANAILNFHFDYRHPSLMQEIRIWPLSWCGSGHPHMDHIRRQARGSSPWLKEMAIQIIAQPIRDGWRHQNWWIIEKIPNGIWPPPTPPPPWTFSENSSVSVPSAVPYDDIDINTKKIFFQTNLFKKAGRDCSLLTWAFSWSGPTGGGERKF